MLACMAILVNPGKAVGIEHLKGLADLTVKNISKSSSELMKQIDVVIGDGRNGIKNKYFNAIHVGACAIGFPQQLVDQLKSPGRMVVPIQDQFGDQSLYVIDKDTEGNVTQESIMGVRYVPLTDTKSQSIHTIHEE